MAFLEGLVKLLAVVGGFAVGALAVGLVIRLCGWWLGTDKAPRRLGIVVRVLGGVVGSWLVWLLVSGPAGSGLLGGGGSLFGERGKGAGSARDTSRQTEKATARETSNAAGSHTISVVMLGGLRVVDSRFYQLEGTKEPMTFDELKKAIQERRDRDSALRIIEIKIYQNSVASNHPVVKDLEVWAMNHGFTVSRPPPENRDLP